MKGLRLQIIAAFILVPLLAGAQSGGTTTGTVPIQGAIAARTNQAVDTMASSSAIKILSPKADEKIGSSALSAKYELLSDAVSASGSPNYRLQLDARDPVETTSTEHSFSGLSDGNHVLTVELIDANGTPIIGSQTEVHFTTSNQPAAGTQQPQQPQQAQPPQGPRAELQPPSLHKASLPLPPGSGSDELPSAGGELPLLSMVGFGVLVGGVISAMRTRR
jgi:hypothetical protein